MLMKNLWITLLFLLSLSGLSAQKARFENFRFTEASTLTMTGKLLPTENPYNRVDTNRFKGFTEAENLKVRCPAGMAVAFRTNSPAIAVYTRYGFAFTDLTNTNGIAFRGYDLYIRKNGEWLFADAGVKGIYRLDDTLDLISGMDTTMKECLLYLPLFSEAYSIQIGVKGDCELSPMENPFRHRIGVFGSSFTHGESASRSGMCYPSQLSRTTGLEFLNLGCSGNCRLQDYFADVLCAADMEALLLDAFSNPTIEQIEKRLFPFIEKIQAAHPGMPIIFQRTIRREGRNFRMTDERFEQRRIDVADSLMAIAVKKYKDVYYIYPEAGSPRHDTSVDGIHPNDYGYTLWAESIEKPLLKILKKYGIR